MPLPDRSLPTLPKPVCLKTSATLLGLLILLVAMGLAATVNRGEIAGSTGKIFFVDADCYARMTRVREVCARPGTVLRQHGFENYPIGTVPHTTAPLDYLIALLNGCFQVAGCKSPRDLAGAWISPLLGIVTILALFLHARAGTSFGGWMMLLVFVVSPIAAHGFAFGRPDHQSLELASLALALTAEWSQWREPSRAWGFVAGGAWAAALWTSLYEPTILLALALLVGWVFGREKILRRERLPGLVAGGIILLFALWCEGWRLGGVPGFGGEESGANYFAAWSGQIGELRSMPPWSPTIYRWTGWGILATPVLLVSVRGESRPLARAHLTLVSIIFALACWQVRWGYFLLLVYAMSLPVQFLAVPARWRPVLALLFLLGCLPPATEWWERLHPSAELTASLNERREDMTALREVAAFIKGETAQNGADPAWRGMLAPWWFSPALAYWSQQPAVAGSSHESLPGIVAVDQFYLASDFRAAANILRTRRVRWVLAYEPSRIAATAAPLLGQSAVSRRTMCVLLYERPELAPAFLRLALVDPFFKLYEVQPGALPPAESTDLPPSSP